MQIVGVAQSCRSGNQARFVPEHIFIINQQKTLLYSTFLGSENFNGLYDGCLCQLTGADPGFRERGFICVKVTEVRFADSISCSINIP